MQQVRIIVNTFNTYHGVQEVEIYQNGELIASGSMNGDDEFAFDASAANGECRFTMRYPAASSPLENGESGDGRVLSLALRRIKVYDAAKYTE